MQKTKRGQSTVTSIYDELRRAIAAGELREGVQLKQTAIGAQFGVSKIPVREALTMLEADGFVEIQAGKGATVTGVSAAEALEIYLMRMALEPMVLRHSLPNLTPIDLARADAILHTIDSLENISDQQWHMLDHEFHATLYQGAPHERMKRTVVMLHDNLARYFAIYKSYGTPFRQTSDAEHRGMLAACQRNDVDAACEILTQHLKDGSAKLQQFLEKSETAAG